MAMLGLVWTGWASACLGADEPTLITNIADLNRVLEAAESQVVTIDIEGTTWWSSKVDGRVILQDESGVAQLELHLPFRMPELGERLLLKGDCLALKTRDLIKLSGVPVVDHDGVQWMGVEKAGTIHLKAGLHPIRVAWFDRTKSQGLEVTYEGPGVARQMIPPAALFRPQTDAENTTTNFVNGLNYRCYEALWWRHIPNFAHLPVVKAGVVDHFDITVRSRDEHAGLFFTGFIKIPKDGDYTFHLRSDDGSQLFIGESSLRIMSSGTAALPSPRPLVEEEFSIQTPEFQWSEIEGVVTAFQRLHGALEIDVMTRSGPVKLKVAQDSERSYTLRLQNRIQGVGVSRRIYNLNGSWVPGEFFVQQWEDVEQRYISSRIWTEYPLVEIGDLISQESSNTVNSVVHLSGRVLSQGTGQPMVLEDGSGRIVLDDAVPDARVDQLADMLGRVAAEGSNLVLQSICFRQPEEAIAEAHRLPVLTTIERICQLNLKEAARGYPVRVRGVVTSIMDYEGVFEGAVIQDASQGIFVNTIEYPVLLKVGDYCEVEGKTTPFDFQPVIQPTRVQRLGAGVLPTPVQPTWDQLINGSMHCNYVELEGVLASVTDDGVVMLTRDGRINVRLNLFGAGLPPDLQGATVRLRGCLLAEWNAASHQVVIGSIALEQHTLTMVHPAPADPFSVPLKHVGDLLQFDPQAGALQRIKVSGLLVHQDRQTSYLMDGVNGLRFTPIETGVFQIGDRLEVVGFVDLSGPSPLVRDAVVRRLERIGIPSPRKLQAGELVRDEYDSTLVQMEGILLDVNTRPEGVVFEMQTGLRHYAASVNDQTGLEELPEPGSRLELTGVYVGQGGNRVLGQPIDSFMLLLNSGRDVRVLAQPPWWTFRRVMTAFSLLIGVLLAALIWINLLHRKVDQRTQQLGDQIRKRQYAERQRAIEHERARLAHNLHDDLGSGLTEVNLLASLATSSKTPAEEKAQYSAEMNKLLSRMVLSLDEIVWAENPKNDTLLSLAGYFGAHAQRLLGMAAVSCGLEIEKDLPDHPLDPKFRQGLFLAFKEAITNVIKHAKAKKVWLKISTQGDDLVVIVADDGTGMLPAEDTAGADGLTNMRARMSALGGQCEIQSDPDKGTRVRFQAPIQRVEK